MKYIKKFARFSMKKSFFKAIALAMTLLCIALVFVGCNTTPDPVEKEITIELASFNIRLDADSGVRAWSYRKQHVFDYILQQNKDIICMQEVNENQYFDLVEGVGSKYNIVYYGRQTGTNPEGLAILYDKVKFTAIKEGIFWLSETPHKISLGWGASYYRICVSALLRHNETGKYFDVYNTHLDHQVELARSEGIKLVMNRANASDFPAVVCGDMNGYVGDSWYDTATELMYDCQANAVETEYGPSFNGWGENDYSAAPDGEVDRSTIDFCFASDDFEIPTFQIHQDKIEEGVYYSDHFMVSTTLVYSYWEVPTAE